TGEAARQLTAALREQLPQAMVGTAAGTAQEALAELQRLADWTTTGVGVARTALDAYAVDLAAAQRTHAVGRGEVHDAADRLSRVVATFELSLDVDLGPVSIDLPDVPLPDPVGTARNVTEVVALAVSGLRTCVRGAEDAQLAVDRLERALGDARGDAALAGRRAPAGFSVLDTAVMAAQSFDADPDHEHLDERQWAMLQRALAAMSPADRAAVDELLARVPDAASRAAVLQVLTGGADLGTATFFADRLAALPDALRAQLLSASYTDDGPTALGDPGDPDVPRFDQTDQTTCGSTSLLALAAQSDPLLSLWLLTGDRPPGWTPPYLQGLPPDAWDLPDADDRLTAAQQGIHDATSAGGWPQALGTTPWDAASVADDMRGTTGTGYQAVLLDDQSRTQLSDLLTRAADAANAGTPVPLYAGGDGADGIPRHVVLITGYRDGTYEIFEPSSGEVYEVPESQLLDGGGDGPAGLGGWEHPDWVVLPEAG
ncbi:serine/threonine-protein kinase, partial [Angustibacter aerolatus]